MKQTTYRAIWRWHFHAGLFCIPFVVILSITGSIYLFKPQIDSFADRDVNRLEITGTRAAPSAHVNAALAALPGARLVAYELPRETDDAVRIHLMAENQVRRIAYVDPASLEVLKVVDPESTLPEVVKKIHGELLIGNVGSILVELAACWAIVMIATGLYLWWPRNARGLAGVLYPRTRHGSGIFWRDLHSVTGLWISALAIFLLLTALPWTTVWGTAFKSIRAMAAGAEIRQDWATGRAGRRDISREHAGHHQGGVAPLEEAPRISLDAVVPRVAALDIADPVTVRPPTTPAHLWSVRGESANRMLRRELDIDSRSGQIVRDRGFEQREAIDRVIGFGITAHEGQLFGLPNQLLGLLAAVGLITLCVSAIIMWWRRRPEGALGVPAPKVAGYRVGRALACMILALAVLLPVFGASLLLVGLMDRWAFRRTAPPGATA